MEETRKLTWAALEYEEKERSNDWYWALGVVVIAGSLTAIIFENYFFAMILVIGGALMIIFSKKKPDMVVYELNEKGLKIRSRLYPYEKIKSFWVRKEDKPTLFIKSERLLMPIIPMPIEEEIADDIRDIMLSYDVLEEEMKDHPSEKIMDYVGF